jgi:phenylacetate-CoA ligase
VLHETPCACGQESARIRPILRRADNRVSVRGIPFHPEQLAVVLQGLDPALADFRLIIHTRQGVGEQLEILVARSTKSDFPGDSRSQYLELLRSHIRRTLGLGVRVQLVESDRLPMEGMISKTVFKNLSSYYTV